MVFPFLPFPACFVLHQSGSGTKQAGNGERAKRSPEGGWQGVRESAVRAKLGWGWFGAQPARSETPVRAAAERRPPGRGAQRSEQAETNERRGGTGSVTGGGGDSDYDDGSDDGDGGGGGGGGGGRV